MAPRKKWDSERMKSAVSAVRKKEMGSFKAARIFNVPQTTLERYVKMSDNEDGSTSPRPIGRQPTLSKQIESDLTEYCVVMEHKFYGLKTRDVRAMAFKLANLNGINHNFSKTTELAGRKWLKGFFRRNPKLSIRQPQGLSFARAKGFNPNDVSKFFDLYDPCLQKIGSKPSRLFNCDETGITIVQHKHSKVVALKGKKQVACLQSAERGALMTVVTCASAAGQFVPPMIIFPRKNMKLELMNGTPPGSVYDCHPSGWIQSDIFTKWFLHFIGHVKPTAEDPVLLVFDGHFTHTRNIDVINIARENHVIIVCLPPHSSHKMQPLDVSFMKPLKVFYSNEIETWLRANPGRVVTVYQIGELLGKAYMKAATVQNAVEGFRTTGLFPLNKYRFGPEDFPLHPNISTALDESREEPQGGTSTVNNEASSSMSIKDNVTTPVELVKASQISPIPIWNDEQRKKNVRAGSAEVITSSPYKQHLQMNNEKKSLKIIKKNSKRQIEQKKKSKPYGSRDEDQENIVKKKGVEKTKRTKPTKKLARKLILSSSEDEDDNVPYADDSAEDNNFSDEDDDAECLYCSGRYSEDHNGEDWVRCTSCLLWSHTSCADLGNSVFVCDFCARKKANFQKKRKCK